MPDAPSLFAVVRPLLIQHEGYRLTPYRDSLGIWTCGVGLNLEDPFARRLLTQCGADVEALAAGTGSITTDQCDYCLKQTVIEMAEGLSKLIPGWAELSVNRQAALLDMAVNLGIPRLSQFHQMIFAIQHQNWPEAAHQALESKWAEQVGERAQEIARMLIEG